MSDDVNFYIMKFEPKVQKRLMEIRFSVFDVFQNLEERIYHAVPTITFNSQDIMNYGAFKSHISIWLSYNLIDFLKKNYLQYGYTKHTIQFPHKDPFPNELIKEICEMLWKDR